MKQHFSSVDMLSCDNGPAVLRLKKNGKILKAEWWRDGSDITADVEQWIKDNQFPSLTKWGDEHKAQLKLAFYGQETSLEGLQ